MKNHFKDEYCVKYMVEKIKEKIPDICKTDKVTTRARCELADIVTEAMLHGPFFIKGKNLVVYNGKYYEEITDRNREHGILSNILSLAGCGVLYYVDGLSRISRHIRIDLCDKQYVPSDELVCFPNGVLNINTRKFCDHSPELYPAMIINDYDYIPGVVCEEGEKFLRVAFNNNSYINKLFDIAGASCFGYSVRGKYILGGTNCNVAEMFCGLVFDTLGYKLRMYGKGERIPCNDFDRRTMFGTWNAIIKDDGYSWMFNKLLDGYTRMVKNDGVPSFISDDDCGLITYLEDNNMHHMESVGFLINKRIKLLDFRKDFTIFAKQYGCRRNLTSKWLAKELRRIGFYVENIGGNMWIDYFTSEAPVEKKEEPILPDLPF